MLKRVSFLLAALILGTALNLACTPAAAPENTEPEKMDEDVEIAPFILSVTPGASNLIFNGKPVYTLHLENPNPVDVLAEIKVTINTDKNKKAAGIEISQEVAANGTADVTLTPDEDLEPGFYKLSGKVNRKNLPGAVTRGVFGVSPDKIVYDMKDKQADFDTYWDGVLAQLEAVDMSPRLVEVTSHSSSARKVYFVELKSIANGKDGEPETIHGYYVEPQTGENHPVIMHFEGYDTQPPYGNIPKMWCPYGGSSSDYAEFYVSTRGQMINARNANLRDDGLTDENFENAYGDWFAYGFGDLDSYYYRGAFMDCVQCIRFMVERKTKDGKNVCDKDKLFAEGKSQGGAFSYAAAALSPYPLRAIAPGVAFLGDFKEYFGIVDWPGNTAKSSAKKAGITTEEMYTFLSYFDTKNLATRIPATTSVIANMGLEDTTCPPRTNQAPFNTVKTTDKEMHVYPEMGHSVPEDWAGKYEAFFAKCQK